MNIKKSNTNLFNKIKLNIHIKMIQYKSLLKHQKAQLL